eukprot:TRINITY_DN70634_c0_g1_i1.p2 TRINITY_DN70634_c0_g1~~TRINITY_DN70634_c0_g1_i1.p2  ORF type:complete len:490 (-),score=76.52 TRINITY_DN70634_c0_g1_i1:8034-9503(-)
MSMPPTDAPRVAIIGAGLAGLSAAVRLFQRHHIVATVFESQPRVGGRVLSVTVQPSAQRQQLVLDLGATWFHGTQGNAAYDAAKSIGAVHESPIAHNAIKEWDDDSGVLLFSAPAIVVTNAGAHVVAPESTLPVVRAYAASMHKLENDPQNHGYKQHVDESVMRFLRRSVGFNDMTITDKAVFNARDALEACINGCDSSTDDLSAKRISDYVTLKGDNVRPHGGMRTVVDAFVKRLEQSQIKLSQRVVRVAYHNQDDPAVHLVFDDGHVWEGHCVLWTPALNVTNVAVEEDVFEPQLPQEKIAAMTERVQGVVEKVFVMLSAQLVNVPSDCSMPVIWECIETGRKSYHWWTNVYSVLYSSEHCMVSFWLTGGAAKYVSSQSDELRLEQTKSLLEMLYSQSVIIEKVICSEWGSNPSTLGSYTYPKVGCSEHAVQIISRPVPSIEKPLLCFAGEATHQEFFSTMHGAIESGYREADRIAAFMKELSRATL